TLATTGQGKSRVILFSRMIGVLPMVSRILFFISIRQMYKGLGSRNDRSMPGMTLIFFSLQIFIYQDKAQNSTDSDKNINIGIIQHFAPVQFAGIQGIGRHEVSGRLTAPVNLTDEINQ